MDTERALLRVNEYLDLLERANAIQDQFIGSYHSRHDWKQLDREITSRLSQIEQIAVQVDSRLAEQLRAPDGVITHYYKLKATRELKGTLERQEETAQILEGPGPRLSAVQLHPWVWQPAAPAWSVNHRRDAIQRAATSVFDTHLRSKVDRHGMKTQDLVAHVFNPQDPKPGEVRLRLPGYIKGTPEWTDIYEGMRDFGKGCARAIRNLTTHGLDEPNEPVALEALASLSFLARRIDDAVREDG